MEDIPAILVGPVAALALSLLFNLLFYKGKVTSSEAVPREDYKALQDVNASYAQGFEAQTKALNDLIGVVKAKQMNGGL